MHNWKPSLSYQRFSRKQYELNRLYWTQILSSKALLLQLADKPNDALTINEIDPDLPTLKHMHTVEETKQWLDAYLGRSRLHLLVISSGNLETYLHEITFWYLYDKGYADRGSFKLNPVGIAMGAPILKRASIICPN